MLLLSLAALVACHISGAGLVRREHDQTDEGDA